MNARFEISSHHACCLSYHITTLYLEKTRLTIVTIISSNRNRFSKLFHCWKVFYIGNKTVYRIAHHT